MKEKEANLIYALDKNGNLVHVDNVNNGLKCECVCPKCKSELNAKNEGKKKIHHFAHKSDSNCQGAVETAIHMLAKEILHEIKSVLLPSTPDFPNGRILDFDNVEIETFDSELNLQPDCIGYYEDKKLWIEFKYTHAVDLKKREKIILANIDCVEIDISDCIQDRDNIKERILNDLEKRKWIYNEDITFDKTNTFSNYQECYNSCNKYNDDDWDDLLKRILAIDENGNIISSKEVKSIDTELHKFYCIACKQEVCVNWNFGDYFFKHIKDNNSCTDEYYLINTTEYIIKHKFDTQKKFEINIEQPHYCSELNKCPFYNESICYTYKYVTYDLKELGYKSCQILESDTKHLVISRCKNDDSEIIIKINEEDIPFIFDKRILTIDIYDDNDLLDLISEKNPIIGGEHNFKNKKRHITNPQEIIINYYQFNIYSSGKFYLETEKFSSCNKNNLTHQYNVKKLYIIKNHDLYDDYDSLIKYFLLYCYKTNKSVRFCEICFFLKDNNFSSICTRYKTKSTPKYPLEEKTAPLECPYFSLNTQLKNHIEYKYKNFKIIEYPFFEQTTK